MNIASFQSRLDTLSAEIGPWGGRYFVSQESKERIRMNDLVREFECLLKQSPEQVPTATIDQIIRKIRMLDQAGENLHKSKNILQRIATWFRRFPNHFYNRNSTLNFIEFGFTAVVTSRGNYHSLPLVGENGTIRCRVRGVSANPVPKFSPTLRVEFLMRTLARLKNLIAVRGNKEGARMIGPCDYYGNLENPHLHAYTIEIKEGMPAFIQHDKNLVRQAPPKAKDINECHLRLACEWCSGKDKAYEEELRNMSRLRQGESLFQTKGALKIAGGQHFELPKFDAREVDLTPYKARLVRNDTPFQINSNPLPASDEYRVITYEYQSGYADFQVKEGGGLFLETHPFAQTMTPLDPQSVGFVNLAKWSDESKKHLDVIAVEIPFGYTLVVDSECIHGDATLDGRFMMCMTSNHRSMDKADTVFLVTEDGSENVMFSVKDANKPMPLQEGEQRALGPDVTFK